MQRKRAIGAGRSKPGTLSTAARQLNEALTPNPLTVNAIMIGTGRSRPTIYRWLDGEVAPDAVSAEWLRKHAGITGSWKK